MRLSTRLIGNAVTTYLRIGASFLFGVFFTWYVVGQVGLVGFGMIALAGGGLGLTIALELAVLPSITRFLAAAIADGRRERIERTVASALALGAMTGGGLLVVFAAVAGLALAGVFRTPPDQPELRSALAILFLAEATLAAATQTLAPFHQALLASQRLGLDNLFLLLRRASGVAAAVLAFGVLGVDRDLATRISLFAACHVGLSGLVQITMLLVARLVVPGLRFRRTAFDGAELRVMAATAWHTAQVTLHANMTIHVIGVIINLLFGLTYNGMWQIVVQVGGHVRVIADGITRGLDPLATHLHAEGRVAQVAGLMVRTVRYQLCVALPVTTLYALFLVPILGLWVGGRLANDAGLAAAGMSVAEALGLVAFAGTLNMLAELARAASRGMERLLYGLGHVRDYAWFSKWASLVTVAGATAIMWTSGTPLWAPLPLAIMHVVYFDLVIPAAAMRRTGLSSGALLGAALPRPVAVTVVLALPMLWVRSRTVDLDVGGLAALLGAIGLIYAVLILTIGLVADERERLLEMFRPPARNR